MSSGRTSPRLAADDAASAAAETGSDMRILYIGGPGEISFAAAYAKPVRVLPITERTPLHNPHWAYSRAKAEMETILRAQTALPYVIVRPSHTYRTKMPTPLGGEVSRLLRGKPILVHGDG